MSEYERTVPTGKKFLTGHPLFDRIIHLTYGSSVLMLDETFSEAQKLLHVLFENYGIRYIERHFEVVPYTSPSPDEHILAIGDQPLSDISIDVNKVRTRYPNTPIIHTALPDMIMKNEPDDVLRLLMAWQKNIREAGTVEFYILPKGTFQDLERKILAVVDGGVEIRVDQTESRFRSYIKPIRCCSPESHLKEFQYVLDSGRLLIRLEDRLTDELATFDQEEIVNRMADYKNNLRFLKVVPGEKKSTNDSVYENWMLSQVQGKLLSEIDEVFPEDFDHILQKIAAWQISDVLRVVRLPAPLKSERSKKTRISSRTRFALKIPTWFTTKLIGVSIAKPRTIPLDSYLSNRKSTLAFIDMLLAKLDLKETDYMERLLEMQKRFNEIGARETAIKHIRMLGENSSLKVESDYVPKILELTFYTAYRIKVKITKVSEKEYLLEVPECWWCSGIHHTSPVCSTVEGTVEGICGVIFKTHTKCKEVECKAVGDEACIFKIELD